MSHLNNEADDERTIPSRKFQVFAEPLKSHSEEMPSEPLRAGEVSTRPLPAGAPWLLQQHFTQQIDLGAELAFRYPSLPLLSVSRFRELDIQHGVALLASADGVATVMIDADGKSGVVDIAFSYASNLSLHFRLDHLNNMDRSTWLERMRREKDDVGFLWGESRWEKDYAISILRKRFMNLFAFSAQGFSAAARLTPDVVVSFLNWLESIWKPEEGDTEPPQLLTW